MPLNRLRRLGALARFATAIAATASPLHASTTGPAGDHPVVPTTDVTAAVNALIARVLPAQHQRFKTEIVPPTPADTIPWFELRSHGDTIVLRGNNGVEIASALDWYVEHVAHRTIDDPLRPIVLDSLPAVRAPIRRATPFRHRWFFNYCTFSYSMAWWDWAQWERMIDWMALKGIDMPLAVTGQEAVWQRTLRELGFSDTQISAFLVGPAYLPWGWMGNVDGIGGPLPQHWIDTHVTLERRILARERALGMTPVLQGFTGHVPESITTIFPHAKVHRTGDWSAGFPGTWFLDPTDSLFGRIGRLYMENQTKLFGTDHYYAADSFNEIDPPTNDSTFLAGMGRAVYDAMRAADPRATWVLQGWFLYYQAKFWQEPQARALLGAVPDEHMLVLDLWGDRFPVWEKRQAFYGKPWVWNVLYNFGGKVTLNGDVPAIAANLDSALRSPAHGRLSGLGMMMEGLGYNPIVPDFVFDMVWRDTVPDVETWAHDWVTRRYGADDPHAWSAWKILLATAYRSHAETGTFLVERPQWFVAKTAYRSEPIAPYPDSLLADALDSLLAAAPALGARDAYRYDVVNLTRQALGSLAIPMVDAVKRAYDRRDRPAMTRAEGRTMALLADMDTLLATRREFLLGPWIADATRWGKTPGERALYEYDARNIITLWGTKCTEGENDDLNLYAHKQWSGMFSSYYAPRWATFFRELNAAADSAKPFDRAAFAKRSCAWEQAWSRRHGSFPTTPRGDALAVARRLRQRWIRHVRASAARSGAQ